MEIKMQLKHLIIVGIVVIYTFGSIFLQLANELYNPTLNVAFVYNKTNLLSENEASSIWTNMETIQQNYNKNNLNNQYDGMQLENVNISSQMKSKINEYALKNEVVVLLGDSYNDIIGETIKNNPQTKFIMIDSNYDREYMNLKTIDVNNQEKYNFIANKVAGETKTKKVLYVETNESISDNYNIFTDEIQKINPEIDVQYLMVNNIDDKVEIKNKLTDLYATGIDYVYVDNQELNKIVIETTRDIQKEIDDNEAAIKDANAQNKEIKKTNKEISEAKKSNIEATDKNNDSNNETTGEEVAETTNTNNDESKSQAEDEVIDLVEVPKELYPQKQIKIIVNGEVGVDASTYYLADGTISESVVAGYLKYDINYFLEKTFKEIAESEFKSGQSVLSFKDKTIEYIEELE